MATYPQRLTSLLTAVLDAAPTAEQEAAIKDAYVGVLTDDAIRARFGAERAALTNANKAKIVVTDVRSEIRRTLREHARSVAEEAARGSVQQAENAAGAVLADEP